MPRNIAAGVMLLILVACMAISMRTVPPERDSGGKKGLRDDEKEKGQE